MRLKRKDRSEKEVGKRGDQWVIPILKISGKKERNVRGFSHTKLHHTHNCTALAVHGPHRGNWDEAVPRVTDEAKIEIRCKRTASESGHLTTCMNI